MTLKEKFSNVQDAYHDRSSECVEIADDFAIGFAEWKDKYICENCNGDGYTIEVEAECCMQRNDYCCGIPNPIQVQKGCYCNGISTKELLEIYKLTTGL